MITIPAMRLQQFGTLFYQAALSSGDVRKLVRFETLAYQGSQKAKRRSRKSKAGVNWLELEKKISGSEKAYQRPIMRKKIDDLVAYYRERHEHMDLAPIPGAVILVSDRRLDFTPATARSVMGHLQLPEEEGLFRTLDGQHRLLALAAFADAESERADVAESLRTMSVPAVIFENLSAGHSVEMFVTINTKHTRLKKDVIVSLSGRRLYKDERMAAAHDIIRSLNDRQDSPLYGDIRILGVGPGKVSQAPLAAEIDSLFRSQETASMAGAKRFREQARGFFLAYFKQVAGAFPQAWKGRKYSLKRGTALRAFIRVVPDVISACREQGLDYSSGRDLARLLGPWAERVGDRRFETDGEWRLKSAGGGSRTVDLLVRELKDALA
ncbi:MAG TPA: DGQHR domain-containing protein [Myxococcota bacterium]|nr:DGQHR domain-containing protein [Myxococcota bacterium]